MQVGIEVQKLRLSLRSDVCKLGFRKFIEKFRVGLIVHAVFPGSSTLSDIKIVILQLQRPLLRLRKQRAVTTERGVEAGLEHVFGLRRGRAELQDLQRPPFRN